MNTKMAASKVRAQRFVDDSADFAGSTDFEPRMQRKSTRIRAHKSNDEGKSRGGSRSRREERIGERNFYFGERNDERNDDPRGARSLEDEVVKCLCACSVEKGEMVSCDICKGWSHLRCLGMKEEEGLMEGKVFVCYFCLSAHMMELRKELGALKEELNEVKSELIGVIKGNKRLKRQMEQERPKGVEMTQEVAGTGGLMGGEMVGCDKLSVTMAAGERQKQTQCQHEPKSQTDSGRSHNNGRHMEPRKVLSMEKQNVVAK